MHAVLTGRGCRRSQRLGEGGLAKHAIYRSTLERRREGLGWAPTGRTGICRERWQLGLSARCPASYWCDDTSSFCFACPCTRSQKQKGLCSTLLVFAGKTHPRAGTGSRDHCVLAGNLALRTSARAHERGASGRTGAPAHGAPRARARSSPPKKSWCTNGPHRH